MPKLNRLFKNNDFDDSVWSEQDSRVDDALLEIVTTRPDLFEHMLDIEIREGYGIN